MKGLALNSEIGACAGRIVNSCTTTAEVVLTLLPGNALLGQIDQIDETDDLDRLVRCLPL